ncbi:ATP-binding protein [Nonomuraea sp. NPDC005650]|uniref:ATP-binding protein n=1 Tax=Nonomuraea sp. NPDC005650 TaxID=3157045 RepID=UPI00339E20DE
MDKEFLAELVFPGKRRSVSMARHCVGNVLQAAGHRCVDGALLVVSELVGNAVLHTVSGQAGGLITVAVREMGDAIARIDVIDQGASTAPQLRTAGDTSCSGRGLQIVGATAIRWGVHDDALGGRAVWAEVFTAEDGPIAVVNAAPCEADACCHRFTGTNWWGSGFWGSRAIIE